MIFLTIVGIILSLCLEAWLCMQTFGVSFLFSSKWDPLLSEFGALLPILGTLVTSCTALLIATPMSLGISFFITEILYSKIRVPLTLVIELLAVIPSIIYGMWGLFIFAPHFGMHIATWLSENLGDNMAIGRFFEGGGSGTNVLTVSIILALMVIPFMTITFKDSFEIVPQRLK